MTTINIRPLGTKGAYNAYGGVLEFLYCKDPQCFIYGGTGTGKTVGCCYKLIILATKYPGIKALITRDSYVALVKSGIETFENCCRLAGFEIGKTTKNPNTIYRLGESKPTEYRFPYAKRIDENGRVYEGTSRILVASLSNAKDELGAEYDYVYLNQPELSSEDDWQFLGTRCNGRRGKAPYPQLFGDPNPEHEQHWIKKGGYELIDGEKVGEGDRWRMIKSTYKDNPVIWDQKLNCFTKEGEDQVGILLQSLNPVMKRRLIDAEWCSYEGSVFGEVWNRSKHVIDANQLAEYEIDETWDRYWTMDFGFDHPFVWALWCKHPHKELYIRTKLIYMSDRTFQEHAETIKLATVGEPRPKFAIADREPQAIAVLTRELGINIISAKKGPGSRVTGANIIYDMLQNDQLLFYADALVEADPRLLQKKKPIGFENEVGNIRWKNPIIADGKNTAKEEIIDADDHEMDSLNYLVTYIKANQRAVPFIWT